MFTALYLKWKQLPKWLMTTRKLRFLRYVIFIANCFLVPLILLNSLWPVSKPLAGILGVGVPFLFSIWFSVESFRNTKEFDSGTQAALFRMMLANSTASTLSLLARYSGYGADTTDELFLFSLSILLLIAITLLAKLFRGKARRFLFPVFAMILTMGTFLLFVLTITV